MSRGYLVWIVCAWVLVALVAFLSRDWWVFVLALAVVAYAVAGLIRTRS